MGPGGSRPTSSPAANSTTLHHQLLRLRIQSFHGALCLSRCLFERLHVECGSCSLGDITNSPWVRTRVCGSMKIRSQSVCFFNYIRPTMLLIFAALRRMKVHIYYVVRMMHFTQTFLSKQRTIFQGLVNIHVLTQPIMQVDA